MDRDALSYPYVTTVMLVIYPLLVLSMVGWGAGDLRNEPFTALKIMHIPRSKETKPVML